MAELTSLEVSEDLAAQVTENLRQYEPAVTSVEEAQDAVQTILALADVTLMAWMAVQRLVDKGIEGGRARSLVAKVCTTVQAWLVNLRFAIDWMREWHRQGGAPLTGLNELRQLEAQL